MTNDVPPPLPHPTVQGGRNGAGTCGTHAARGTRITHNTRRNGGDRVRCVMLGLIGMVVTRSEKFLYLLWNFPRLIEKASQVSEKA